MKALMRSRLITTRKKWGEMPHVCNAGPRKNYPHDGKSIIINIYDASLTESYNPLIY